MSETNGESNWHQDFIASNLLVIGYNAWAGHLSHKPVLKAQTTARLIVDITCKISCPINDRSS